LFLDFDYYIKFKRNLFIHILVNAVLFELLAVTIRTCNRSVTVQKQHILFIFGSYAVLFTCAQWLKKNEFVEDLYL